MKYPSINAAARLNNIKNASNITAACNGTIKTAGGYYWRFEWQEFKKPEKNTKTYQNHTSPVIQYDNFMNELNRFKTAKIAAEFLGKNIKSNIIACCRGKRKQAGGYHWRYA